MADPNKRYDDKQVGLILRRATELATQGSPESAANEGFSLAELEQIALEAGIDPDLIRRAAHEVEATGGGTGDWQWVLGAPMTIRVHRVVDAKVPDDMYDTLLSEIHLAGIGHGAAGLVGSTLSWKGTGTGQNPDSIQITVTSRNGRTELHAEQKRGQTAAGLMGGLVGGGGVGFGAGMGVPLALNVLGSVAAAFVIPAVTVGAFYGAARGFFKYGHKKKADLLGRLLDRLVVLIEEGAALEIERAAQKKSLPGEST